VVNSEGVGDGDSVEDAWQGVDDMTVNVKRTRDRRPIGFDLFLIGRKET